MASRLIPYDLQQCVCVFKKGNGTKSVLYFGEGLVGSWPVGSSLGGQGWDALRVCMCVCVSAGMLLFAE